MNAGRRAALVTGASSGIGRAFAECFARDGWNVAIVARDGERLRAVAGDLHARFGVDVPAIELDLAAPNAAQRLFDAANVLEYEIDALVNNAGFATYGNFAEIPLSNEREELCVNVVALTEATKLFLRPMLARGRGRICNVASTAGFLPGPKMAVYYASKAYVLSFSEALSEELRGSGVSVTCLAPGPTASGFQARAGVEKTRLVKRFRIATSESVARAGYAGMHAGKRLVVPGLMNRAIAFAPRLVPRSMLLRISKKTLEKS